MMTRCEKCGRVLTDPASIDRGIGPVCSGHRTNRYKLPEKRAAYEWALELAGQLDDEIIWRPQAYWDIIKRLDLALSCEDRRQVAAKAVRVLRGIRRRKEQVE